MRAPVVRISIGQFDAGIASTVERRLNESRAVLEPGIRAMRGNLGFWAGVDLTNNSMTNVSFWDSLNDAQQMATFQAMLDLAKEFTAMGVHFQRPIMNFTTLWEIRP